MAETKKLWLGISEGSQLGKLLHRLAHSPTIKTSDLTEMWSQTSRSGGQSPLTPSRAAFLVDTLAEATEGHVAVRIKKGVARLAGIRDALRFEEPQLPGLPVLGKEDRCDRCSAIGSQHKTLDECVVALVRVVELIRNS